MRLPLAGWRAVGGRGRYGASAPVVANGLVYVTTFDMHLEAFDAITGVQLWSAPAGGLTVARLSTANDLVYVSTKNGHVAALGANGVVRWSAIVGVATSGVASSPVVVNGGVYFTTAMSQMDGRIVHKYALPNG